MELYEKKTWKRTEILRHLREQIKEKKPILMGAAGIGLVAKMEANGMDDLIMTTSADRFRMDGQPSAVSYLACRNANDVVVQNLPKIVRMTGNTPVVAGVATGRSLPDTGRISEIICKHGSVWNDKCTGSSSIWKKTG